MSKVLPGQHALEKHLPEEAHRPWCGREMVLPVATIAGIQVRIHLTFLLLLAFYAWIYYIDGGPQAAVDGVVLPLDLFVRAAARIWPRPGGEDLRHTNARYHLAANRRSRSPGENASQSSTGVRDRLPGRQ